MQEAGGATAATRVTDIEELLAQAMGSVYLVTSGPQFWSTLLHRLHHRDATRVVRGDHDAVVAAATAWAVSAPIVDWSITAVQPGVADSNLDGWSAGNALMSAAYAACRGLGRSVPPRGRPVALAPAHRLMPRLGWFVAGGSP